MASKSSTPLEITDQSETIEFELNKEKYKLTISNNSNKIQFKLEELLSLKRNQYFIQTNLKELQNIDRFFLMFENLQEVNESLIKQVKKNNIDISKDGNLLKLKIKNPVNDKEFTIELNKIKSDSNDVDEKEINDSLPLVEELRKKIDDLEKRMETLEQKLEGSQNLEKSVPVLRSHKKVEVEEEEEEPDDGRQLFKSNLIGKKEEKVIKGFLQGKLLSAELIFDTAKDGDSIDAFKTKIAGKFPTLFIIKTDIGVTFGAYATSTWVENKFIPDYNSFVFTLNPNNKYKVTTPKFGLFGYNYKENIMFQFGGVCFRIEGNCTKTNNNIVRGSNYEKGFINFIQGDHKFRVSRLEIFKLTF